MTGATRHLFLCLGGQFFIFKINRLIKAGDYLRYDFRVQARITL